MRRRSVEDTASVIRRRVRRADARPLSRRHIRSGHADRSCAAAPTARLSQGCLGPYCPRSPVAACRSCRRPGGGDRPGTAGRRRSSGVDRPPIGVCVPALSRWAAAVLAPVGRKPRPGLERTDCPAPCRTRPRVGHGSRARPVRCACRRRRTAGPPRGRRPARKRRRGLSARPATAFRRPPPTAVRDRRRVRGGPRPRFPRPGRRPVRWRVGFLREHQSIERTCDIPIDVGHGARGV